MVFRLLIRYLANNERLVQKLSESYPIRRSAQFIVSLFLRSKNAIKDAGIEKHITNNRITSFADKFKTNLKQEFENAKKDLKNKHK